MKSFRTIEAFFRGPGFHIVGDGFKVTQYFPQGVNLLNRFSPFVLLDYNPPCCFGPSSHRPGVGAHPYRGFEIVTIDYAGKLENHDNKGNHGIIGPGDVQWMTAGSGVINKEYHETEFSRTGGVLQMVQLWVNLPKRDKMVHPRYQTILKDNMGIYKIPENQGEIRIISGEVKGVEGPAKTFSKVNLYDVNLKNHGCVTLDEPSDFNTGILIINGEVRVNNDDIFDENEFILFDNVEGSIKVESISEESLFLVLSGKPLYEPVVVNGSFVMNTEEEIAKAYDDFKDGKFGTLNF